MSANLTINENGITAPQTSEVKQAFQEIFTNAFGSDLSLDDATPQGSLIDDLTRVQQEANSNLMYALNQYNPNTANGVWQDALASLYFIQRKSATRSIVNCECTGVVGTVLNGVASGNPALAQSANGDVFECVTGGTIPASGTITLAFRSQEAGVIPVSANTVNRIYQAVSGWDTITNPSSGTLGTETESREEFEARRKKSVALNATGSLSAVLSALANVDGVEDIKVYENVGDTSQTVRGVTLKAHSIWVCVNSGVSSEEIGKVLHENKSAGADTNGSQSVVYTDPTTGVPYTYKYDNPTDQDIYFQITTAADLPDEVKAQIKQAIVSDFNGLDSSESVGITIGDSIYASRFVKDVTAYASNLISVKISDDGEDWQDVLTFNMNILPTISETNIEFTT
jgi:uncharacterized phage protein gp47/JayE